MGTVSVLHSFAPLAAIVVCLSAVRWEAPSASLDHEGVLALSAVEALLLCRGRPGCAETFSGMTFVFWMIFSLLFAPWWFLGLWIGQLKTRRA